jgi:hypothetical protein
MELYEQVDSIETGAAPIDEADIMDQKTLD